MCEERNELEEALSRMVGSLDTALVHGADAKVLVGFYSRIERLASAGKSLCALRVAETGSFTEEGHRHVGEWLAAKTGESVGGAVSLLEAAGNLSKCPDVKRPSRKASCPPPRQRGRLRGRDGPLCYRRAPGPGPERGL